MKPRGASNDAVDLCRKLLEPDPAKRLGTEGRSVAVKEHPWFRAVDFYKVCVGTLLEQSYTLVIIAAMMAMAATIARMRTLTDSDSN